MVGSDGFELDKTESGRMRVNVISVANLLALIALIATAFATWNGLTSKVDMMAVRVDGVTSAISQTRQDLNTSMLSRDADTRDMRSRIDTIGNRMTAVETVIQRVERRLESNPQSFPPPQTRP